MRREALPQSAFGKAAAYVLNHWPPLGRYAQPGFGHVLIDNNSIEHRVVHHAVVLEFTGPSVRAEVAEQRAALAKRDAVAAAAT